MFTYIFHILEFPGISWNFFISRKLPGNDQDFPEFGKFPSKWKHWANMLSVADCLFSPSSFSSLVSSFFLCKYMYTERGPKDNLSAYFRATLTVNNDCYQWMVIISPETQMIALDHSILIKRYLILEHNIFSGHVGF